MRIALELIIFFGCILIGARLGGIALGTVAGIGLAIFVFIFALPPGGPPPVVRVHRAPVGLRAIGRHARLRLRDEP